MSFSLSLCKANTSKPTYFMYFERGGCQLAEQGICKEIYSLVNVPKTPTLHLLSGYNVCSWSCSPDSTFS